ncbi:F0F1 ATP synthase assembly protein [Neorhizobium sp. SOG26]|jgi:ATP synthase protein I|uniref:ATP synthase protein I n=1 Tax=Neorhizobium turbinariae TaxID=2937795 RepID=A0ABT0IS46_9HYPH|nr:MULTISPECIES: AtpZ/AtpI family protein [Neorhizobium]AXV14557.1 F0F1 ATP synthase assembly protein [Neorhizobium sp. SOG26]MCK8780707.1 AtpZ/AtpI family protein [Neorhizobium turbinariae]
MTDDRNESLEERRRRLSAALAERKAEDAAEAKRDAQSEESRKGMALGFKISSEFISAVAVGAVLGFLLDRFAGTSPWGMIVFLLLGFGAGVLNVLRAVGKVAPSPFAQQEAKDKKRDGS